MLFLGPIYHLLSAHFATRINHFALVKLLFLAIDKSIFYFLIFALIRLFWLLAIRRRRSLKSESLVWILAFYVIFVLMFTTFRDSYFPWQLVFYFNRPLSEINLVFLKETWKLVYGQSEVDFIYNFLGNIMCFIPIGFLTPLVFSKKESFLRVAFGSMLFSIMIEALQFILQTGVSDIDDVFFNTLGGVSGYLLYLIVKKVRK